VVLLSFGTFALPAHAQVRSVTPRARLQNTGYFTVYGRLGVTGGGSFPDEDMGTASNNTIMTKTLTARATNPSGGAWSQGDIDSLTFRESGASSGADTSWFEAYIDVVYNEAPVSTVTAPAEASTILDDSSPAVSWTYSDPESDTQERYQAKVFSAAQYGAAGFDPSTSSAVWESGEVLSSGTSVDVGAVLSNGTYRAYVRTADTGSSGRYGAWDYNEFTVNVTGPPTPTLTATADNTLKRVELVATSTGAPAVEFFDFEYSDDSGATWVAVRGATRVAANGTSATVHDYESPPNTPRQYRARAGRVV